MAIPPGSAGYPSQLDDFTTVSAIDLRNNPSLSKYVTELGRAVEALEGKIGVTGSGVSTSIDALLKTIHNHDGSNSASVAYASLTGVPSTFTPASHAYSSHTGIPSTFAPSAHTSLVHSLVGCKLIKLGDQGNFTDGVEGIVAWGSTEFNVGGYADAANNQINPTNSGLHLVWANIGWDANNTGRRRINFKIDGVEIEMDNRNTASGGGQTVNRILWIGNLTIGQNLRVYGVQTSGSGLGLDEGRCNFGCIWLGV